MLIHMFLGTCVYAILDDSEGSLSQCRKMKTEGQLGEGRGANTYSVFPEYQAPS